MKRVLILSALAFTINIAFAQIPIDNIKAILKKEVVNKRSKSIIVGIVDVNGSRIIAEGKINDTDTALPDANTIYEIGSITKVFTSLLLADMSLKKQLSLEDPVSRYLPKNVKVPVRNGKEISLLSLATNRSGLPRNAFNIDPLNLENPFAEYNREQLYDFISHYEQGYDVNTKWRYSNIGYSLLGDILSIAGKKSYKNLVSENICKPLNMQNTFFSLPADVKCTIASGYTEYGQPASNWNFTLAGGGGLRSNMNDMLIFAKTNLGFIQSDLLPAMEMCHVLQAKKDGNDTYTTMGWTLANDNGKYILFKDGGTGGYRTFIGLDKINKTAVVVLSNTNNPVTDIGWHILDETHKIEPYKYPWTLLDTLRSAVKTYGVDSAIELYQRLRTKNDSTFVFNENQLNFLGNELRKDKKISDAIKVYELNLKEYPKSVLACESLGETYKRNDNAAMAIKYFEQAMELEPDNPHWAFILEKLKSLH
jgi:D-alanyl-D-alanine-carboxypeptidase/D-alanyl-D-alanine-endopeptidase